MRFEFLDTIIRLALAKYRKTKTTDNSWDACQMLMDLNLPRVSDVLKCDPNEFRSQELCVAPASHYVRSAAGLTGSRMCVADRYTEAVDNLLADNIGWLKALFVRLCARKAASSSKENFITLTAWLQLWQDLRVHTEVRVIAQHARRSLVSGCSRPPAVCPPLTRHSRCVKPSLRSCGVAW